MRRPSWLMWLTAALLAVPAVPAIATCCEVPPPCIAGMADECPMPEACTIVPAADHPPGAMPSQVVPTPPVAVPAMFTGPDGASLSPRALAAFGLRSARSRYLELQE